MTEFHKFIDPEDLLLLGLAKKFIGFENRIKGYYRAERTRAITSFVGNYFRINNFKVAFEFRLDGYKRTNNLSSNGGIIDLLAENKFVDRRIAIEIDAGFKKNSVKKLIFCNKTQKTDMLWILHRYAKNHKELSEQEELYQLIEQNRIPFIELHKIRN